MTLTDMITRLRIELKDSGALWSDTELSRSINKATADVDRHFPLDAAQEYTLKFAVADEKWTAVAAGTYVQLGNKPIRGDSETVKDEAGDECTRDTDYYMDYINGKITAISTGTIVTDEKCTISYDKSKLAIDLSALNIIRIQRVEYPYGRVPQSFTSYDFFNDKLIVTGEEADAQSKLTEGKHIVIYYLTSNTLATSLANGSYPRHLDEVVIKGGAAYACFIKAIEYEHQAITDFAASRSVLSTLSAIHSLTDTALDAAVTALSAATSIIGTANIYLTGATFPGANYFLDTGDAFINDVNVGGQNVAPTYAVYAQRSIDIAMAILQTSAMHNSIAGNYLGEANGRIAEMDRHLAHAAQLAALGSQNLALADRWRIEATERRNEFWSILRERAELRGRTVATTSVRQVRA